VKTYHPDLPGMILVTFFTNVIVQLLLLLQLQFNYAFHIGYLCWWCKKLHQNSILCFIIKDNWYLQKQKHD